VKLLVRGDLHLDLISDGLRRLDEQARVVEHTLEVVRSVEPDVFVDLGDLFDRTRPSPAAYALALQYSWDLADVLGPNAYILAGNHDKPSRGVENAFAPLEELTSPGDDETVFATVVIEPYVKPFIFGELTLAFLPYVTDWEARNENGYFDSAQALLDDFARGVVEQDVERIVAFTHLEVPGAVLADDDRVQRDVGTRIPTALLESEKVVRIFAGHVHKAQEVGKVTVVGSALHVDFGEATDPKGMIYAEV
jgi:DNA repair exonuclease SbcCD nuclease subunit